VSLSDHCARAVRSITVAAGLLIVAAVCARPVHAQSERVPPAGEWVEVDYAALIDRRQLSHSGEPVGELLRRLGNRAAPSATSSARATLALLDPLLEPYAFVLQDALDAGGGISDPPLVEIGSLWQPGEAQPAWVELVRARRFLVESDGHGRLRLCLPAPEGSDSPQSSVDSARAAYEQAWPVLRHLFAAERHRLAGQSGEPPNLQVEVHAYRHWLERSRFRLGIRPHKIVVDDTRPHGNRPPLDLERVREFALSGLHLEGGRIESGGNLRLLGSRRTSPATLLGQPLDLADFAVAYRAVFHGGLAEPYMSLDRGLSPQTSIVNYGGRLRDTTLGMVSLLCDIRFKTFSLGLDVVDGRDLRRTLRDGLPDFRTHYERFAAHPDSGDVLDQQTRLWFYPDDVDLTISRQGDLLAMRRVRMTAASERFQAGARTASGTEEAPWTRETVEAINRSYDSLAGVFPELADLDQLVRLLSFFTWLKQAQSEGLLLPELEGLLAVELPRLTTPRRFPQLLSYNVLPRGDGVVEVLDRLPVGEALERLGRGARGPLPARRRLLRALSALDPAHSRSAALLEELRGTQLDRLSETQLDLMAYRAERVRMHQTVLATLRAADRERLTERRKRGEELRFFSIGIGGLELGMSKVLSRASGRSMGLGARNGTALHAMRQSQDAPSAAVGGGGVEIEPRQQWRRDSAVLPATLLPHHGWSADETEVRSRFGGHWIERGESGERRWLWTVFGADGPEPRSRKVFLEGESIGSIERVEASGLIRYRLERKGDDWRAVRSEPSPARTVWSGGVAPVAGLAVMQIGPPAAGQEASSESATVGLRLLAPSAGAPRRMETDFPRAVLQRLLLGPEADLAPGAPLPGFSPLPGGLERIEALMVSLNREQRATPWDPGIATIAGEEDPDRLARALNVWWHATGASAVAVVGTDPQRSAARWSSAPRAAGGAVLLLPEQAFLDGAARRRERLVGAWSAGEVATRLPSELEPGLVVLISDEPPGLFGDRLRTLARSPALRGKLLAAWSLSGPVRQDLPSSLLAEGNLAGLGLAETSVVGLRGMERQISELGVAWSGEAAAGRRVETLVPSLLWYF
jgi:hypothetical protein